MSRDRKRLDELLLARATEGLDARQAKELAQMLRGRPELELGSYDLAAAAAANALVASRARGDDEQALPASLRSRLEADAERYFDDDTAGAKVSDLGAARAARRRPLAAISGWAVAALLMMALALTWRLPEPAGLSPSDARAQLLETRRDNLVLEWSRSEVEAYTGVSGDVVWNDNLQEGYLRLRGVPANEPGRAQYQLWIVDTGRDRYPVDGGVFDIPAGMDEVIVPIRSQLPVTTPDLFAITLEQPGGVVVSEGPLLVVASRG